MHNKNSLLCFWRSKYKLRHMLSLLFLGSIALLQAEPSPVRLTPPSPDTPLIHGAKVFGVRLDSVFLYTIAATGKRPMTFSAENLPPGLKLDPATGQISGVLHEKGDFPVTLHTRNSLGDTTRSLRIVAGSQIALTPPMGWNSWNCWGEKVSQEKVMAAAKAFVEKGLINHGWTYINIDDGWQGLRGGPFNAIQPNAKFPDMMELSRQIHARGLKLGIYSTPWRGSYAGHIGSSCDNEDGTYDWIKAGDYRDDFAYPKVREPEHPKDNYVIGKYPFLKQDAKQWEAWGIDYLKYDWNPVKVPEITAMHETLSGLHRDVVYSLSNGIYFNWAKDYPGLANCWRISGDIVDTWKSLSDIGFNRNMWGTAPPGNDKWAPYVGPGHYIDPDMLVVGQVGWGNPHPTRLTPDEQYSHISLWCLLAAPLMLGCEPGSLDDFTLGLLTNDEVLDVDQDPLCQQAKLVAGNGDQRVYAKTLEDGSLAVGLFNLGAAPSPVAVRSSGLSGFSHW